MKKRVRSLQVHQCVVTWRNWVYKSLWICFNKFIKSHWTKKERRSSPKEGIKGTQKLLEVGIWYIRTSGVRSLELDLGERNGVRSAVEDGVLRAAVIHIGGGKKGKGKTKKKLALFLASEACKVAKRYRFSIN